MKCVLLTVGGDSNLMAPDELKNLGMLLRWDGRVPGVCVG